MTDLVGWLERLGLSKYASNFHDNEVELSDLPELSDDDLRDIGLPLGPRRRVLKAIRDELFGEPSLDQTSDSADHSVGRRQSAERRQLTVLFCDLAGSMSLSIRLDPEDYRETIRSYQDVSAGIVARYDGYVAKFMGDGVLAYFGWPRGHENDAERALSAGLDLVETVSAICLPGSTTEKLKVRIGVATGPVVVGDIVGEAAAQEAAVTGETPNLAARLQQLAEPNSVVIAETTRALAGGLFDYVPLGDKTVKGVDHPVSIFRLNGRRSIESRFEARNAEILPMVGRDQELALLQERWIQVKGGEGQGVLLVGEAGIGKSRIVRGLTDSLSGQDHIRIHYQCSPFHGGSAFWPVTQQLRHAANLAALEDAAKQMQKLEWLLRQGDASREDISLIAELVDISETSQYPRLDLTPPVRRARTLEALVRQLAGLAALQPVLMVLEDAHWIDPTTLELIENCLDVISDKAVMVLLTSRPDNQPQLAAHPHVTRLTLNRLGRVGLKEIIARLGGKALPEDTIDAIIARTDGVPLFVEELTKAILETGQTTIPVSLHDSLMSRLDRFPDVKEVAQIAACIGREFDFSLLGRITERTEAELTSALERLISAELVFRRGSTTTGGFIFKHALVRDAAYESLLKGKRQDVHSKLVHVLEDQKSATPEVIARHAEAAGMIEKAIEQWAVSGAQAINRPAYKEAIASYNSAVSLCQSLGEDPRWQRRELELQVALGQALIANRGYQAPATLQTFERALALAEAIGEAELLVPPLYGLWASRYLAGQPSADLAERMADIVSARDDTGAKCVSARMLALETYYKAQYHRSLELVDEALSIYDVDNHRGLALRYAHDPRAAATFYKAWNLWHLGYPERAKATAEEALEWARHIDHPNTLGISLCYGIALTNIWIGDHERVRQAAEEALLLAQEKSLGLWEAWGRIYLGWAIFQDDRQEGLGELMAGITASRRIGAVRHEAFHLGLAADMHSRAGLHDQIDEMFEKAFAVLDQTRDLPFAVDLHRLRATACLRRSSNEADVAQQHLLTALDIARTQQALSLELRAATDLAKLWANAGERSKALELLSGVRVRITEGATLPDLVNADTLLSNWS